MEPYYPFHNNSLTSICRTSAWGASTASTPPSSSLSEDIACKGTLTMIASWTASSVTATRTAWSRIGWVAPRGMEDRLRTFDGAMLHRVTAASGTRWRPSSTVATVIATHITRGMRQQWQINWYGHSSAESSSLSQSNLLPLVFIGCE